MAGIEPATDGLRNRCSTTELHWHPQPSIIRRNGLVASPFAVFSSQSRAMNAATSIQLAAPGAGLPAMELAASRLMFASLRAFKTPEWATQHFQREAGIMARAAR